MSLPRLLLLKKELRQNSLFYLLPLPFVFIITILKLTGAATGLAWLVPVCSVAVPFTLAVAYGLQAFDIEEDKQTRDFLLVKPLSIIRIVTEKFLIGFIVLIIWTFVFWWLSKPEFFELPQADSVASWAAGLILAGILLTYGCSFLIGLWVLGPKKLLAVLVAAPLTVAWAFFSWSSWATFLIHNFTLRQNTWSIPTLQILIALAVVSSLVYLFCQTAIWLLHQRPRLKETRGYLRTALLPVLLLLTGMLFNLTDNPPLRISHFIGLELIGLEQPGFWTLEGEWKPTGDLLAVSGPNHHIGLARPGAKPKVIYESKSKNQGIIPKLSWSPDGKYLAFEEEGKIYLLNMLDQSKPFWVGDGTGPCWAHSGNALLFAGADSQTKQIQTEQGPVTIYHHRFYRMDLQTNTVRSYLEFDAEGKYWTWDETNDTIWYVSPTGELISVNLKTGFSFHPIPETPTGRPIVYAKFYRMHQESPQFVVALYYYSAKNRKFDLHFYALDPGKSRITPLHQELGLSLTSLIFCPQTGTYLIGKKGAFVKHQIPHYEEVNP